MELDFYQALHLVRAEPTKGEALEMVAILSDRKQISADVEIKLDDWIDEHFQARSQD